MDGRLFVTDKHNSAIIDDWPLHPTKRAKGLRLVVGACWEGTDNCYLMTRTTPHHAMPLIICLHQGCGLGTTHFDHLPL